nr:hypothetical protein [Tanacetum cinerariifolium]
LLLDVQRPVEAPLLARALEAVQRHHDGLNLSFRQQADHRWQQVYRDAIDQEGPAADSLWVRDVADDAALVALCEQAQRSL